jgi:predicted secreted protein with PEFG-CTERM motif
MKPVIIITIAFVLLIPIPVFAQEMGFYSNERYDFSFEAPIDWLYNEELRIGEEVFQVVMYPPEFSIKSLKDSEQLSMAEIVTGLPFGITSPLISVQFENISESKISTLNEKEVMNYALEQVRLSAPNARILNSNVESNSWGWTTTVESVFNLDIGVDQGLPYHAIDTTYFFKDRESYYFGYGTVEENFEAYYPTYENALDTLIIKSVAVPEFGSIAMLILVVSIVAVIVSVRKFQVIK